MISYLTIWLNIIYSFLNKIFNERRKSSIFNWYFKSRNYFIFFIWIYFLIYFDTFFKCFVISCSRRTLFIAITIIFIFKIKIIIDNAFAFINAFIFYKNKFTKCFWTFYTFGTLVISSIYIIMKFTFFITIIWKAWII